MQYQQQGPLEGRHANTGRHPLLPRGAGCECPQSHSAPGGGAGPRARLAPGLEVGDKVATDSHPAGQAAQVEEVLGSA